MNLVKEKWLPFLKQDGNIEILAISDIVRPDVIDLALPRPDFQGAAYQLIIGLLQTLIAPNNKREWHQLFNNPPTKEELQNELDKVSHAFNLIGDGPLFMQDYDPLEKEKENPVVTLLLDSPGENGIKKNTDHFVKRDLIKQLSLPMAALALFTLQINAPSGGQGHRVGLRGGGPLTNLLRTPNSDSILWQNLCLNIICKDTWSYNPPDLSSSLVFPWLGKTKSSHEANSEIYQNEMHPLATFWSMPRRIRLIQEKGNKKCCISDEVVSTYVSVYNAKTYGNNYAGAWIHPLTSYRFDPKKPDEIPNSLKAQLGGLNYGYWDVLTLTNLDDGQQASLNIQNFYRLNNRREDKLGFEPRLWCFGYDMDKMKARGYYDVSFPLFNIDHQQVSELITIIKQIRELSNLFRRELITQVKNAWFERPKDAKGDFSFISIRFWQKTENIFFELINCLIQQDSYLTLEANSANSWLKSIQKIVMNLFDEDTLTVDIGDIRQLRRVMIARRALSLWVYNSRAIKGFKEQYIVSQALLEEI